jgi:hypothetical protein
MAITYKWDIPAMNAHVQSEGQDNVIHTVHYRYTGSEELNNKTYLSSIIGTKDFTYTAGEPFTPYENTEAFENIVIEWLEDSLDIEQMQSSIAQEIEYQITPVNEDLHFTWKVEVSEPIDEESNAE